MLIDLENRPLWIPSVSLVHRSESIDQVFGFLDIFGVAYHCIRVRLGWTDQYQGSKPTGLSGTRRQKQRWDFRDVTDNKAASQDTQGLLERLQTCRSVGPKSPSRWAPRALSSAGYSPWRKSGARVATIPFRLDDCLSLIPNEHRILSRSQERVQMRSGREYLFRLQFRLESWGN